MHKALPHVKNYVWPNMQVAQARHAHYALDLAIPVVVLPFTIMKQIYGPAHSDLPSDQSKI